MKEIDLWFLNHPEPVKSCLLALREIIPTYHMNISEAWKYRMPFYCYHDKMFCYLWVHKKYKQPYLGFVEGKKIDHPELLIEKRSRMKILLLDPGKDIPMKTIDLIMKQALRLYQK
jgi:hypothetical protein